MCSRVLSNAWDLKEKPCYYNHKMNAYIWFISWVNEGACWGFYFANFGEERWTSLAISFIRGMNQIWSEGGKHNVFSIKICLGDLQECIA
jgi:hypothetical protein